MDIIWSGQGRPQKRCPTNKGSEGRGRVWILDLFSRCSQQDTLITRLEQKKKKKIKDDFKTFALRNSKNEVPTY